MPEPLPVSPSVPLLQPEPALPAVRVRLFAALREAAGWSERLVALPVPTEPPCTPLRLWRELGLAAHWSPPPPRPACEAASGSRDPSLPAGVRVAINHGFADPDTRLQPGDELAFLPPITGG